MKVLKFKCSECHSRFILENKGSRLEIVDVITPEEESAVRPTPTKNPWYPDAPTHTLFQDPPPGPSVFDVIEGTTMRVNQFKERMKNNAKKSP